MRKETCAICGKVVYVEQGDEFEWEPGAIQCAHMDRFFCTDHKPCCASDMEDTRCDGLIDDDVEEEDEVADEFMEDIDDEDDDFDDEEYDEEEDPEYDLEFEETE